MCKVGWCVKLGQKEKGGGQTGSSGRCLKEKGLEPPYKLCFGVKQF